LPGIASCVTVSQFIYRSRFLIDQISAREYSWPLFFFLLPWRFSLIRQAVSFQGDGKRDKYLAHYAQRGGQAAKVSSLGFSPVHCEEDVVSLLPGKDKRLSGTDQVLLC
jgi:hypothetical protein